MFAFIGIIALVLVLVKISSLQEQIFKLEKKLSNIKITDSSSQSIDQPINSKVDNKEEFIQQNPQQTPYVDEHPSYDSVDPVDKFVEWFKENWILKVGVLLILTGFGWFISYAFIYNWIGPAERIALGLLIGIGLSIFGSIKMKKNLTQGGSFIILGTTIFLITTYASRFIYDFFNPVFALSMVFVASVFLVLNSLKYDTKYLAVIGIVMAAIAPTFTNVVDEDILGRFLYIAVVSISSIWVMFQKNWREIGVVSALSFLCYSLYYGFFGDLGNQQYLILSISYVISGIFFITNIFSIIKFKSNLNESDFILAILNGIMIMFWTISHVPENMQSLVLALSAVIFLFGSYVVFVNTKDEKLLYIYLLISVVYIATATALELEGNVLVFAYIFESAVISIAGYLITNKTEVGESLSLLLMGPMLLSIESFNSHNWLNVFNEDFAIILCIGIVLMALGYFYFINKKEEDESYVSGVEIHPYSVMLILGSFYLYALLWLSLGVAYSESVAVLISLSIYTIIGITTYFYGKTNLRKVYMYYGGALLLLVVARLLLIDVWDMELALRIITFVVIGILFVSTSFIGKNKKNESIS